MKKIGFETTAYKRENYLPAVIETTENEQETCNEVMSLEEAMKRAGWEKAQKLVYEFLFVSQYGNHHRLTQQLIDIKNRFFVPI